MLGLKDILNSALFMKKICLIAATLILSLYFPYVIGKTVFLPKVEVIQTREVPLGLNKVPEHSTSFVRPVLFVHGYNASPESWGFSVGDEQPQWDNESQHNTNTVVIRYFTPGEESDGGPRSYTAYTIANYFQSYSLSTDINHNWIECFNASNRFAHITPTDQLTPIAEELYNRIIEVLNEYFGTNWQKTSQAKIILICHSQGGLLAKYLFDHKKETSLANPMSHIERVITIGSPFRGSPLALDGPLVPWPWDIVKPIEITALGITANVLGPYPIALSIQNQNICLSHDLFCLGYPINWCFQIQECIEVPALVQDGEIDPFVSFRVKLQGMIEASVNFNAASSFIQSISSTYATNPYSGAVQPWIFIRCRKSDMIEQFLKTCSDIAWIRAAILPMPSVSNTSKAATDLLSRLHAYNEAGDLIVPWESQSLYDLYPESAKGKTVFEIPVEGGPWHSIESERPDLIIQALEKTILDNEQAPTVIIRNRK